MRWRALPSVVLLLLGAPLAQRMVPSDVIRVEDPEPLPDTPKARTAPPAAPVPASPALQLPPPATPDGRILQPPVLVLPPERPAPPGKAPVVAPK